MKTENRLVRTWISLVIAVVFAIAAMPGSMAMPAPKPMSMSHAAHAMSADCSAHEQAPCDHMKAQKNDGKPCKNMAMCLGLLSCYGMGAVDVAVAAAPVLLETVPVEFVSQTISGLTLTPDNPPPIA
jgi:hypothetical protein